jgi:hypothetical protein
MLYNTIKINVINYVNKFFFPVPVCAITASGVPGVTFVSTIALVPCAGD